MNAINWRADLPDLYVATRRDEGRAPLHLLAEVLPFGGWEWLAWSGDHSGRCLRGEARDRASAMLAAEQGARLLGITGARPLQARNAH